MRVAIVAVGRARNAPESPLIEDYAARIRAGGRSLGFAAFDIIEIEAPKSLTGDLKRNREGEMLLAAAPAGSRKYALDERGEAMTSAAFAARLAALRDQGAPGLAFFIGGADGLSDDARAGADKLLAFGPATWPHMLVRAMLCEQIYRAMTILSGHPYHRA